MTAWLTDVFNVLSGMKSIIENSKWNNEIEILSLKESAKLKIN